MLNIKLANKFESLLDSLLDSMAERPASPLVPEQIIVPSAAVRRKLTLSIADRYGICSNVRFSFLAHWLWRRISQVVPSVAAESPFAPPVLAWRVFHIFDDASFVSHHPRLADYLRQADPVLRYELAARAASLIEQYMTYRPDWLAAWSDGKSAQVDNADTPNRADEQWQSALWRRITEELGTDPEHPATSFLYAVESMGRDTPRRIGLPETAHVFCLPTMSPLYINILRQLGRWIDLRLYVLNPCREYWFEVVDRRRLSYLTVKGKADYHQEGNRLLAAWANQTQAYVDLLLEDDSEAIVEDGQFEGNDARTLLAHVQNAILDLVDIEPKSITLEENDRSIEVHVCHSLTRELEVLQDQLLALFASPNPLQPSDILVVTPDLEAAAPLIDAVFGNVSKDRFIPYALTGRPRSTLNATARGLLALLSLVTSRFQASAVFDLLQQPIVGRRFSIVGDELTSVHDWIRDSAIRWGIDAKHRAQFALPDLDRYSFVDGLHRLYLGYALPAGIGSPFNGRLAAGDPEGSDCVALGSFCYFVAELVRLHRELTIPKTPRDWMNELSGTLDAFLSPSDDEVDDFREVQETLREMHANMSRGGILAPVPLEVVRTDLEALLDDPARGGVPTGSVTFSSMSSLRNLPYRIICAIGLNDGLFPTASRPPEFDLMAADPRRGDRQRRVDERNLFLDLLLASRDRFYLSYTGRSHRDNAALPASVLVSELVEYLVPAIATDPMSPAALAAARQRLVVDHPLQPFSLACFSDSDDFRRRSFNGEYCDALRKRLSASTPAPQDDNIEQGIEERDDDDQALEKCQAFFHRPLAEPGEEWREVSLEQMIQFFKNPCRYLLKLRLGIDLRAADEELQDDEPFLPDFPARAALAERILP
ncbi:MAG: exodeoxyribonuclease V subunit gamma, partial [Burkholderiales bacterium]